MMLEELERRHYTESTTRAYLRIVEDFARHFHRPPDQLGPEKGQEVPLPTSAYEVLHDPKDVHLLDGEALEKTLDRVVAAITKRLREFWELRPKIYVTQVRNEQWRSRWDEVKERLHAEGYAILPKGILPLRVPDGRIREFL